MTFNKVYGVWEGVKDKMFKPFRNDKWQSGLLILLQRDNSDQNYDMRVQTMK